MTDFYNTKPSPFCYTQIKSKEGLIMYKSITTNLMVDNVYKTVDFYTKILEFAMLTSVPKKSGGLQFAILVKDDLMLMLQDRENLVEEYPVLKAAKTQPSITLFIKVDNFSVLYDFLKCKCEILSEPHKTFYGNFEFAIKDNNGYVLTFTE